MAEEIVRAIDLLVELVKKERPDLAERAEILRSQARRKIQFLDRIYLGQIFPKQGRILLEGRPIGKRPRKICKGREIYHKISEGKLREAATLLSALRKNSEATI